MGDFVEKLIRKMNPDYLEVNVAPDHEYLQYMGRIDFSKEGGPEFVFPCTFVKIRFKGTFISVTLTNTKNCWDNFMGVILDGEQSKFQLDDWGTREYILGEGLENTEHELMLFKRQDSCHTVQFHGFTLNGAAEVLPLPPLPERRIEVYGDSVSAGEVSEAVGFEGQPDPKTNGELSNSYYSYSWCLARRLNAQLHDIAQGGICLLDDAGWFAGPTACKGMFSVYDKIQYHPDLGVQKRWDFSKYTPDVVIVAIGQNDKDPYDYMKADYNSEQSLYWRLAYKDFIGKLRKRYPEAHIILSTTILNHEAIWDEAIDEVCKSLQKTDDKIHHFLYSNNGCGTHGHIRISEAEKMAEEMADFIDKIGVFADK